MCRAPTLNPTSAFRRWISRVFGDILFPLLVEQGIVTEERPSDVPCMMVSRTISLFMNRKRVIHSTSEALNIVSWTASTIKRTWKLHSHHRFMPTKSFYCKFLLPLKTPRKHLLFALCLKLRQVYSPAPLDTCRETKTG